MPSIGRNLPDFRSPERNAFERALDILALLGVGVATVSLAVSWPQLPAEIPRHFNLAGDADAWGSPDLLIWLVAATAMFYVGLGLVPRFPWLINFPWPITSENAARQFSLVRTLILALRAEVVWLFAYLTIRTIDTALGRANGLGTAFLPISLGVVFGTVAVYLVASYRAR